MLKNHLKKKVLGQFKKKGSDCLEFILFLEKVLFEIEG